MAAIEGLVRSFYKKFKFRVEIQGVIWAGFQTCGDIAIEVATIEHHEGGSLVPNKSPGRVTVPDVELTRGGTDDLDLYAWMQQVVAAGGILVDPSQKRSVDIVQQDRAGGELRRWTLINAYPVRWKAGDWDNGADENVIESITLAYDYPTIGGDSTP